MSVVDEFEERYGGVPTWAALQAWDEASDDDTAAHIRRRAQEIAAARDRVNRHDRA